MYTLRRLGLTLQAEGKWPEAEKVHREALAVARKQGGYLGTEALEDLRRLAFVLVAQNKTGDAQKLLDEVLTPDYLKKPDGVTFLMEWVDLMGRHGCWPEARTSAETLIQLQPAEHYNYHRLIALLAITHDRPAYEQICRQLLTNLATPTNPYVAERMVQDCLLLPHSGADLKLVDKLADKAVTLGEGDSSMPYFQACKAMSDYRLGHLHEAIEWADKAAKNSEAEAEAKALAIAAMAHWSLGQKDAALAMLAKGDALAPRLPPERALKDLGKSWVAWIIARISLDEAAALIQSGSTTEGKSSQP
jgi:tetratricopeptide (TPR) repeat protein